MLTAMRILSGIQPSGRLHLGNYFGAIRQYVQMAEGGNECFYFIADYHALTTVTDPKALKQSVLEIAKAYMAFGLNTEKCVFFRQSDVPEVMQLYWILSNVTPMGLLERCHSYKDKLAKGVQPYHGLFSYPVLMAADILMYRSNRVPVGRDQKQHVEVTRDIAQKFNNLYGEVFVLPESYIVEETAVVPGIDGQKMSKSYDNTIELFADEKSLKKRVMSIVTDSTPVEDPKEWKGSSLYQLMALFLDEEGRKALQKRFKAGGLGYGTLKKELLELIMDTFGPVRGRYAAITDAEAVETLAKGAEKARSTAAVTLKDVQQAVGIKF